MGGGGGGGGGGADDASALKVLAAGRVESERVLMALANVGNNGHYIAIKQIAYSDDPVKIRSGEMVCLRNLGMKGSIALLAACSLGGQ
jgi:hypothetical protein